MQMGALRITWNADTRFDRVRVSQLKAGEAVEVKGRLQPSRLLIATELKSASAKPGRLQIRGSVSDVRQTTRR